MLKLGTPRSLFPLESIALEINSYVCGGFSVVVFVVLLLFVLFS